MTQITIYKEFQVSRYEGLRVGMHEAFHKHRTTINRYRYTCIPSENVKILIGKQSSVQFRINHMGSTSRPGKHEKGLEFHDDIHF